MQRRHADDMGHPMLLDHREGSRGARTGRQHHGGAVEQIALQAGTGERQVVRDRQHDQQARIGRHFGFPRRLFRIIRIVVVAARDQLRDPGGAAGKLEHRGIGRIDLDRGELRGVEGRRPLHQLMQRQRIPGRFAHDDEMLQLAALRLHPHCHVAVVEAADRVGYDAGGRARQRDELADLGEAVGDQRGDRDTAGLLQRHIENGEFPDIRELDHHPVQRLQAQLHKVERQVGRQPVELAIGVLAGLVDDRHPVGESFQAGLQLVAQRAVLPVALVAVELLIFGGKGDDAFQHGRTPGRLR